MNCNRCRTQLSETATIDAPKRPDDFDDFLSSYTRYSVIHVRCLSKREADYFVSQGFLRHDYELGAEP